MGEPKTYEFGARKTPRNPRPVVSNNSIVNNNSIVSYKAKILKCRRQTSKKAVKFAKKIERESQ